MESLVVPVLPIPNIVFFPNTALPLYVEEHSYIKMIEDCIEEQKAMAISLAQPISIYRPEHQLLNKVQYRPSFICGIGRPVIIENYENRALKVLVKGIGKVELLNITQNLPYPTFEAKVLKNNISDESEMSQGFSYNAVERISNILKNWVKINVHDSIEREAFFNGLTSVNHVIDYVCMLLVQDKDIRQMMLESNNLYEKVHILNSLLIGDGPVKENIEVVGALKNFEIIEKVTKNAC